MTFKEIAGRLTGISSPIVGVSWTPPEVEVTTARRVIAFLEDRRVLYQPTEMEVPDHCIQSVLDIRQFLTAILEHLDDKSALAQNLRAMRAACRKFLDRMQEARGRSFYRGLIQSMGSYDAWVFCGAVGELRGVVGLHVALIAARNGLDVEGDLATILPTITDPHPCGSPTRAPCAWPTHGCGRYRPPGCAANCGR